ncbi:MAG: phosphatidate cytidylyltransferase [Deltaproteobacteria bacterium]|nr:MAG: phosphatidate cytidylyltransferase [Deltaproteobacteria bacterium]
MLKQRVLTVLIAAPFLIASLLTSHTIAFKLVVIFCIAAGLWEFFSLIQLPKNEKLYGMVLGLTHLLFILFCPHFLEKSLLEISGILILVLAYFCFCPGQIEGAIGRIASLFLGILYIGTFGGLIGLIRDWENGLFWMSFLMATVWMNDTTAYFTGRAFGKHKLAPKVSPGKSIEGFVGGMVGSWLGFFIFWFIFHQPIDVKHGLILATIIAIVGPIGDLSESLLKRSVGAKDSGTMIPGHGGMLDRIDALLFAAPIVYFLAQNY